MVIKVVAYFQEFNLVFLRIVALEIFFMVPEFIFRFFKLMALLKFILDFIVLLHFDVSFLNFAFYFSFIHFVFFFLIPLFILFQTLFSIFLQEPFHFLP